MDGGGVGDGGGGDGGEVVKGMGVEGGGGPTLHVIKSDKIMKLKYKGYIIKTRFIHAHLKIKVVMVKRVGVDGEGM